MAKAERDRFPSSTRFLDAAKKPADSVCFSVRPNTHNGSAVASTLLNDEQAVEAWEIGKMPTTEGESG